MKELKRYSFISKSLLVAVMLAFPLLMYGMSPEEGRLAVLILVLVVAAFCGLATWIFLKKLRDLND